MLDAIPLSLAHVAYGGELNGKGHVDFGDKNDLAPFFGVDIKNKVVNTAQGVLSPIAGQAMEQTHGIRNRGKQTFDKIKTTPMDRQKETKYERRMRERQAALSDTTPPNEQAVDVSGTVVPTSPTAPGRPIYPTHSHPDEPISPIQGSNGLRESEDGIPLTRLSTNQSEIREQRIDADAEAQLPKEEVNDDEQHYFALPGGPGVINQEETDGNDPNAFFHPATKERQPILWLPKDDLGLAEYEIEMNTAAGVESSCRRAILNSNGKVRIFGPPPVHHSTVQVVQE
jgi:hypothetical protein